MSPVRIATRGSRLARWQAERVAQLLAAAGAPDHELVVVSTRGDRDQQSELHAIGGQGVFVKEVQQAVLDGEADLAVHSAKDLPALTPDGLVIGAAPEREDARDALIGARLEELRHGAVVGTGAVRRRAQLAALRPDLQFANLRGNVDTRVAKAGDFDAIVLAAAGLARLGYLDEVRERLAIDVMVPQVGQGVLAVECRVDDATTRALLGRIDAPAVRRALDAERAFLAALGGGCDLPVGAHAELAGDEIRLRAVLAAEVGGRVDRVAVEGADPVAVGEAAAARLRS